MQALISIQRAKQKNVKQQKLAAFSRNRRVEVHPTALASADRPASPGRLLPTLDREQHLLHTAWVAGKGDF